MLERAKSGRDAFMFSLCGMKAIASFAAASAIADDRINAAIERRLRGAPQGRPNTTREIEDFLARYFAAGCCRQAARQSG